MRKDLFFLARPTLFDVLSVLCINGMFLEFYLENQSLLRVLSSVREQVEVYKSFLVLSSTDSTYSTNNER